MAEYLDNIKNIKRKNNKIVFAVGLFDVLTVFDVRYLRDAKACGEILVLGVYSDESIRKKYGDKRPITPFVDRVEILKRLEMIDYLVAFEQDIKKDILEQLKPDMIIEERIIDYDVVDAVFLKYGKINKQKI